MIFIKKFSIIIVLFLLTTSCVETVVVGTVAVGAVAMREKSFKNTGSDLLIETQIQSKLVQNNSKAFFNTVGVTVDEGRVLLTGTVTDADKITTALDAAWQVKGVKEVISEIQVSKSKKFISKKLSNFVLDSIISGEVSSRIFFNKETKLMNYKIVTVNGTVYLLGLANNSTEITKADKIASTTYGVKKVVSHLILKQDHRRDDKQEEKKGDDDNDNSQSQE